MSFILVGKKERTKCLVAMVFFIRWGLSKVSEKAKITKSGSCATAITCLCPFGGGCVVGVWVLWRGEIDDLWSR